MFLIVVLSCLLSPATSESVRDYVNRIDVIYRKFSLDWPFALENREQYETLLVALDDLNRGAHPRDQYWLKDASVRDGEIHFMAANVAENEQSFKIAEGDSRAAKTLSYHVTTKSHATPTFSNGSDAHALLRLCNEVKCERNDDNTCKRGTVETNPIVDEILRFQRELAVDEPLNRLQFLGTHNSFNDHADGYGDGDFLLDKILRDISFDQWNFVWAQQCFTMTDQLNMGVRHLMLDPVYFLDEMRLCHCGTNVPVVDKVLDYLERVLNITLHFDSRDLGCMPHDRTYASGVAEICDWMQAPGNEKEIVMVNINDEGPSAEWGHRDLMQEPVAQLCPDLVFTPVNKTAMFPDTWPTPRELISMGRRLLFHGPKNLSNENIFPQLTVPQWDHDTVKYFVPYPVCGGYTADKWYLVGGESQDVGPIYNGPKEEGLVSPDNLPYLLQCGVSVSEMDLVSPGLIAYATWSWDGILPANGTCPAINASTAFGSWVGLACDDHKLSYACRPKGNSTEWTITAAGSEGVHADGYASCARLNLTFAAPTDGYSNTLLRAEMMKIPALRSLLWIGVNRTYT